MVKNHSNKNILDKLTKLQKAIYKRIIYCLYYCEREKFNEDRAKDHNDYMSSSECHGRAKVYGELAEELLDDLFEDMPEELKKKLKEAIESDVEEQVKNIR